MMRAAGRVSERLFGVVLGLMMSSSRVWVE